LNAIINREIDDQGEEDLCLMVTRRLKLDSELYLKLSKTLPGLIAG